MRLAVYNLLILAACIHFAKVGAPALIATEFEFTGKKPYKIYDSPNAKKHDRQIGKNSAGCNRFITISNASASQGKKQYGGENQRDANFSAVLPGGNIVFAVSAPSADYRLRHDPSIHVDVVDCVRSGSIRQEKSDWGAA